MDPSSKQFLNAYSQRQREWINELLGRVINLETQIVLLNERVAHTETIEKELYSLREEVEPLRRQCEELAPTIENYRRQIQELEILKAQKSKKS